MAKVGTVETNERRRKLVERFASRRETLKTICDDRSLPPEERFSATLELAKLPRNSSKTRVRNRCRITGRPRGYYRKFQISRIALRELASSAMLPGVTKSSW
ncbi:MAG: 30S ribosomal protein S14 [Alphaproteobacteria bacterium]|jgi:small subunit ribosomal protein S14